MVTGKMLRDSAQVVISTILLVWVFIAIEDRPPTLGGILIFVILFLLTAIAWHSVYRYLRGRAPGRS